VSRVVGIGRRLAAGLLAATWCLAAAGPVLADREGAVSAAGEGDTALKAKKWDEAKDRFTRSVEQDPTYLPARIGLAEALLGAGDRGGGVGELRRLVSAASGTPLATEWADVVGRGRRRLAEVDPAYAALDAIVRKHVDEVVTSSIKNAAKDPGSAERGLKAALLLSPESVRAKEAFERLRKSQVGKKIPVFSGKDLSGWMYMNADNWQLKDGAIVASVRDAMSVRTTAYFEGDFDVVVEAMLLQAYGGGVPVEFAMLAAVKGDTRASMLGVFEERVNWSELAGSGKPTEVAGMPAAELSKPLDLTGWNTYELWFRGDQMFAVVNGIELGKGPRPADRDAGAVALKVQGAKVAFRRVDVIRR
jgi:hypothetical protein